MTERVSLTVKVEAPVVEPRHEHLAMAEEEFRRQVGEPVTDVKIVVNTINVGRYFTATCSGVLGQQELPIVDVSKPVKATKPNAS